MTETRSEQEESEQRVGGQQGVVGGGGCGSGGNRREADADQDPGCVGVASRWEGRHRENETGGSGFEW